MAHLPMKLIIFLLLLLRLFAFQTIPQIDKQNQDEIFLREIIKPYNRRNEDRIVHCIMYYSYMYDHPVRVIGKIAEVESGFRYWAISNPRAKKEYRKARGILQVKCFWDHVLYYLDNGRLGYKLLQEKKPDHRIYWHRIGYGIEGGCYIMRYLVEKYGTYQLACVAYNNGEYSDVFKDCLAGNINANDIEYVKKVMVTNE